MLIPSSFTGGTAFISGRKIRRSHPSHHNPLPVGRLFAAIGSLLSLQPAELLAPLTDPTPLALCRLGLLLRSFRQERSLPLPSGMTTVATGQVLLAGSSPAGLAASFAAPSGSATTQELLHLGILWRLKSSAAVGAHLCCFFYSSNWGAPELMAGKQLSSRRFRLRGTTIGSKLRPRFGWSSY